MSAVTKHRLTAIHEAGHAVVGQALGFMVNEVRIREGAGGGSCDTELPPRDSLDAIQRELSFVLAGRLAVALEQQEDLSRFSGRPLEGGLLLNTIELESSSVDGERGTGMHYRHYAKAAGDLLGDELAGWHWLDKATERAANETIRILRERWDDVQGLAIRLDVRGEVDLGEAARKTRLRREIERLETSRYVRTGRK